jgi:RNA polymerase sigma-70 factor (ECF subfamily)
MDITSLLESNLPNIKSTCKNYAYSYKVEYETLIGIVLEKAWRYRDKYTHKSVDGFNFWVGFIIKNTAIDLYRRGKAVRLVDISNVNGLIVKESNLSDQDILNRVFDYIESRFGEKQSRMVALIANGYSYEEACDMMGMKMGSFKSILHRVRKDLINQRELMEAV